MVKHTQTIRRQQSTNCLSVSDHFVESGLTGLKTRYFYYSKTANKINANKRKNQNTPSGYLAVQGQQ